MAVDIPDIDTVVHFTSEIAVVEISTDRDEITLVVGSPYMNTLTRHHEGQTIITIAKEPCRKCKYLEEGKWDGAQSTNHLPGCPGAAHED